MRKHAGIVVIAVAALLVRLVILLAGPAQDIARSFTPDSGRFLHLARNLVNYATFGLPGENPGNMYYPIEQLRARRGELERPDEHGLYPELMRTPGYPAFIALLLWLPQPELMLLIAQCVLGTGIVILTYLLGNFLLTSSKASLTAAAIVAVHPADILYANLIMSEVLFGFIFIIGVLGAVVATRTMSLRVSCLSGIMFGLATLVKPIGVLLGVSIALWMCVTARVRKTCTYAVAVGLLSLLPVGIWMQVNASRGAGYIFSTAGVINHVHKTLTFMVERRQNEPVHDSMQTYLSLMEQLASDIDDNETVFQAMNRMAREGIRADPIMYLRVLADSALKTLMDHSALEAYQLFGQEYRPMGLRDRWLAGNFVVPFDQATQFVVAGVWTLWNVVLSIAMFAGFLLMALKRQWTALLLLSGLTFYFLFTTQAHGLERMRLPFLWVQALVAGYLFSQATLMRRKRGETKNVELVISTRASD